MSGTEAMQQTDTTEAPEPGCAMKLEVIVLPVSDVERTKRFYGDLGWRLDTDVAPEPGFRVVQMTPPHSPTSITFGEGITTAAPGSVDILLLAVDDVEAARAELLSHGAEVGELFHGRGAGYRPAGSPQRAPGRDPDGGSYVSFATFSDPDGNGWLLQEIKQRLPGRLWDEEG
ncbi:MAG TPA: VOC family protein [Solirubrobacteraceae bacterium]|jgi:catechol 2,3-dioxygenase-like lactoylglutathione lyase family enzyme|nr:VOC family protein [Solirubrobacteraceae bacterium]